MCNICRVAKRRSDRRRRIDEEEESEERVLSLWRASSKGRSTGGSFSPSRRSFLHSHHPRGKRTPLGDPNGKGRLPSARRRRVKTPASLRGLPAVAAVSYLGLRGAPLYRRTATLDSPPLSASHSSCLAASLSLSLSLFLCSDSGRYLATFPPILGCTWRATPPIETENGSVDPGIGESGIRCTRIALTFEIVAFFGTFVGFLQILKTTEIRIPWTSQLFRESFSTRNIVEFRNFGIFVGFKCWEMTEVRNRAEDLGIKIELVSSSQFYQIYFIFVERYTWQTAEIDRNSHNFLENFIIDPRCLQQENLEKIDEN